ncbi:MAG: OpgC domain-containing protein, partial [Alphaproteobacteria bacterium]|nr:OpgC domain-containing protein [Alphaproteobacteria bacterium]
GYTAALVYGRTMLRQGSLFAIAQIYRRVWQLYVAHIFIFMIFTAEVSYTIQTFNNPMYADELRVGDFLAEPHIAIIRALLLQFQPTFLDILPLYIALLASFPVVLLLLGQHTLAALLPSLALYVATQISGLALHGYPSDNVWFFNPFAWQLLFTIGAACGFARVSGRRILPPPRWLIAPALVIVGVALVVRLSWTLHGIDDAIPGIFLKQLWPINKTNLGALRLIHFLALAVVTVHLVPADSPLLKLRFAQPIIRCGQQSLQIFCLGILLSVLAHFVLTEWDDGLPYQIAVNCIGFAVMIGTASMLTWYRKMDRAAAQAKAPASGMLRQPDRGGA